MGKVELVVYDFDGVMTNNRVVVSSDGTEHVICHRDDGLGVELIKKTGTSQLILSNEPNHVVAVRANKLGIPVIHGASDKVVSLRAYCEARGIALERVCYVGNGLNDVRVMRLVGYPVCVCDAHADCDVVAKFRLHTCGGEGVVLELWDLLLHEGLLQR